jgi:ribonuclease D
LAKLPVFSGPRQRRETARWFGALARARELPDDQLPPVTGGLDPVPPSSRWRDRAPDAADRLARCREVVSALAEQYVILSQNLLASDVVRRIAWEPPQPSDQAAVGAELARLGARPWQVELTAEPLAAALG